MKFVRLLKSDFKRAVFSYAFLFSVLMVTVLVTSSGYTMVWGGSILFALQTGIRGNGIETVINCILPLVPFAISFATEWKEKSYLFYVTKIGPERYILSKMIISAVSGFLVLLIGVSLAVPTLKLLAPEYPMVHDGMGGFYENLLKQGHIFLVYLVEIFDYALVGWLTSLCAVFFSTYIPNAFAVLAAPMLLNFTILRFDFLANVDHGIFAAFPLLNPTYWVQDYYPYPAGGSVAIELGYRIASNLILSVIMGYFAVKQTRRRVLNG